MKTIISSSYTNKPFIQNGRDQIYIMDKWLGINTYLIKFATIYGATIYLCYRYRFQIKYWINQRQSRSNINQSWNEDNLYECLENNISA